MSKQLKKFAFSTASWLKKIKQTYRLKVFPDKTFDDSCNFLAYKILDLVRSRQYKNENKQEKEGEEMTRERPIIITKGYSRDPSGSPMRAGRKPTPPSGLTIDQI